MVDFNTQLSSPDTRFTQVQARQRPDLRGSQISTAIKGGALAGKEFAKASGSELTGVDLSQKDVNLQADTAEEALDNQITDAMVAGGGTLTGSLDEQERTQREIKDSALSEFAQNDRVLLELRDRGVISTIEARGRRQLNLKRALSNPINALFKGEFLNASKSLTGGARGPVNEAFPFTAEEIKSQAIQKEQVKAQAEHEGRVAATVAVTGRPETSVRRELQDQAEAEIQKKQLERTKSQRALNGEEFSLEQGINRSSGARGLFLDINKRSAQNEGNGLTADDLVAVNRTLDQTMRGMLEAINTNNSGSATVNIGESERQAERDKLQTWFDGMKESLKAYDASTLDANRIKQIEQYADKEAWSNLPDFMFLNRVNPKIVEIMMVQGGLERIDAFTRKGVGSAISTSVSSIKAATDFSINKPPKDVDVAGIMIGAITAGGSTAGLEYVTSPEVQQDRAKKINLAKIYDATPDITLQAYSTPDAQRKAVESPEFRSEIDDAMKAGLDKMNRIKDRIGAEGEVIFAEPQEPLDPVRSISTVNPQVRLRPNKNPNWILNLPDGMQEHANDLKSMHRAVIKQPWMWNHVKDNYVNGSDAFNGFMRGEWDVNVELLDAIPTDTGTSEGGKELEGQEFTLTRSVSDGPAPLQPGAIQIADALSQAPQSFLSASTTARVGEDLDANKRAVKSPELPTESISTIINDVFSFEGTPLPNPQQQVEIIGNVLSFEGGFQANPDDKGNFDSQGNLIGTNRGITPSAFKVAFGKEPSQDELKNLTEEQAIKIYNENYWKPNRISEMPSQVREIAMNMLVMTSPKNAIKSLQRASGAKEDGVMGDQTLKALRGTTPDEIWVEYKQFLQSLSSWNKFGKGWTNRYEAILQDGEE